MGSKPRESRLKRDEKVRKRYRELAGVKENGVKVYSSEIIMMKLIEEFDVSTSTIWKIIKEYHGYKPKQHSDA